MKNFPSTYRKIWIAGVLAFYLAASFQFSLLEGLHFLSHLKSGCTGSGIDHSYFEHSTQSHQHHSLAVFEGSDNNTQGEQLPLENNSQHEVKKNPQLLNEQEQWGLTSTLFQKSNFFERLNFPKFFPSIPTPPPQFS